MTAVRPQRIEILLVGDLYKHNKLRKDDGDLLPSYFKDLITNSLSEIDYILCTGNIGNKSTQQFLKNNCKQYLQTNGDKDHHLINNESKNPQYRESNITKLCGKKINVVENFYDINNDEDELYAIKSRESFEYKRHRKILTMTDLSDPKDTFKSVDLTNNDDKDNNNENNENNEYIDQHQVILTDKELISVKDYKIGMLHGHQLSIRDNVFGRISPCIDKDELLNLCSQKEMDCDILIYGHTNRHSIEFDKKHKKIFINTGSLLGNDTILTTSPLLILNWVRKYDIRIPSNYQFPIPIINLIISYGKQTFKNDATFASLTIESHKNGQECTVYSYNIQENGLIKNKVGKFEDLYDYVSYSY